VVRYELSAAGRVKNPRIRFKTGSLALQVVLLLFSFSGCGRQSPPAAEAHVFQPSNSAKPRSLREAYRGYEPGRNDPEKDAVKRGRREVEKRDVTLEPGGAATIDELLEKLLIAIDADDAAALSRLTVTFDEFQSILWPEFPQSRPAAGVPVGEAWEFLENKNNASFNRTAGDLKGRGFRLARSAVRTHENYTNFRLHEDLSVTAANTSGETVELTMVRGIVEAGGRFKVYSTRD